MNDVVYNVPGEGGKLPPSQGRILIGGLRGSAGKTVVSLGVIGALKKRGINTLAFKKGPDYIDAAWHTLATGSPCYCLDVYMMGAETVSEQFAKKAPAKGVAVIEGNRGLFDGVDIKGSYSTAELAKLLRTPVVLVVDAAKQTRTTAALVLGCQKLDPDLHLAGVVLNLVSGPRHQKIAAESIEEICGIPVLGSLPKLEGVKAPERHLGLVTPEETPDAAEWIGRMSQAIEPHLNIDAILRIASSAGPVPKYAGPKTEPAKASRPVRIGVIRDSAFPFYYPENLESLERAGARLVWIRAVADEALPGDLDALYIGGGFPETHASELAGNHGFRDSLKTAVRRGLPVYAECGGAVYLGRSLEFNGSRHEMAGVIPVDFEFKKRPQGHGYTIWEIERPNPFYDVGAFVRGHEFHYTRAVGFDPSQVDTICRAERGSGFGGEREGVMTDRVVAFYGHVHALGAPEWTRGMIRAAEAFAAERQRGGEGS